MPDTSSFWNIWLINSSKFQNIQAYLNKGVKEVEEVLYPRTVKEYRTSSGRVVKRLVPVYATYLFLKHSKDLETLHKIKQCPYINRHVGTCFGDTLEYVESLLEIKEWRVDKILSVGDKIKVNAGPMSGFTGFVSAVSGSKVTVSVGIFGRQVDAEVEVEDVDLCKG
jgi:transcription antitermination factor NusG